MKRYKQIRILVSAGIDDRIPSKFLGFSKKERVLFVTGKKSYVNSGAKLFIDHLIERFELQAYFFNDFSNNPRKEDVNIGVQVYDSVEPNSVVAIGGGSVIDMAKLVRFYSSNKKSSLIAVPTTAGTGAESTNFAVCYVDGIKHSIYDKSIIPNKVILIPALTYHNDVYLTVCTAFDALAQAIEAFWNINATNESDRFAIRAIKKVFPVLNNMRMSHEDRTNLLIGANLAGRAINITKTTVPHALSYTLTSQFGYPHGHAVALTFPYFFNHNIQASKELFQGDNYVNYQYKMKQLCGLLSVGLDPFLMMRSFVRKIGLGFDSQRDFNDLMVLKGINMERAKNNPIAINESIIKDALKSVRTI